MEQRSGDSAKSGSKPASVQPANAKSPDIVSASVADTLAGTTVTFVGLPGLMPLPWWQTLAVFGYAMVACLFVNDAVKVAMIRRSIPAAAA